MLKFFNISSLTNNEFADFVFYFIKKAANITREISKRFYFDKFKKDCTLKTSFFFIKIKKEERIFIFLFFVELNEK